MNIPFSGDFIYESLFAPILQESVIPGMDRDKLQNVNFCSNRFDAINSNQYIFVKNYLMVCKIYVMPIL